MAKLTSRTELTTLQTGDLIHVVDVSDTSSDAAGTSKKITVDNVRDYMKLTTEEVQDIAGALVATGGTKTLITVTYDDTNGDMDFVVDNDLANYDNSNSQFITDYTVTNADLVGLNISNLTNDSGYITASSTTTLTNKSGNISQWTNDVGYITATLTNEQVQDIVGGMVSSNTETGITVTYQDADGTIDFVVSDTTVAGDTGSTGVTPGDTLTIAGGTDISTSMSGDTLTINFTGSGGSNTFTTVEVDGVSQNTGAPTLDFSSDDFTLTESPTDSFDIIINEKKIQDVAGAMFTGNTETLITVTYQASDGTIDLVVNNDLSQYDNSTSGFITDYTVTNADLNGLNISELNNDSGFITASSTDTLTNKSIDADNNTLTNTPEEIIVAASDESTDLTTGTGKVTFRMPFAMTLTGVRASVNTAPTGSTIIVDINENGSTILGTKLSIDAGEKTSETAASAAVISDSALADDSEISIDIDQIGSTTPGNGLKVALIGKRA